MKVIIDGNSIFYKIYFGLYNQKLTNSSGQETGAIYGFIKYINFLISQYQYPLSEIVVTFDNPYSKTQRKEIYPEYKVGRKESDPNLFEQLNILVKLLKAEGIAVLSFKHFEADDVCYAIARRVYQAGGKSLIISRDHDLLQILQIPNTIMLLDSTKENRFIQRHNFFEVYEFDLDFFPYYKAVKGDSSDNIDGIKGIGDKTLNLIAKYFQDKDIPYKDIFTIDTNVEDNKIKKSLIKIQEEKEKMERNMKLMNFFDLPESFILEDIKKYQIPEYNKADDIYNQLQIRSSIIRTF